MAARLSGLLFLRRLPAGVRLITRHPRRPAPVGTGFQNPNPPLQIGNDCPLAARASSTCSMCFGKGRVHNPGDSDFRCSPLTFCHCSSVSTSLVCHNSPGHASVFPTALSQFTSSSLNSYFSKQGAVIRLNPLNTQYDRDEQEGFKFLFMGSMQGIRNPKAHDNVVQDDPHKTLEYLGLASLLMKCLEERQAPEKPQTQ